MLDLYRQAFRNSARAALDSLREEGAAIDRLCQPATTEYSSDAEETVIMSFIIPSASDVDEVTVTLNLRCNTVLHLAADISIGPKVIFEQTGSIDASRNGSATTSDIVRFFSTFATSARQPLIDAIRSLELHAD